MSMIEENKAIARRFLELVSEHKVEELCAMVSPDWRMYGGPPGLPPGPEGIRHLFGTFGRIQQTWTIEHVVAEGDKVVVRATNRVEQDSFLGIPGQGRTQTFTAMFLHRIAGGTIVETYRNADDLGRVLQLGARIVPPAQPQP